MVDKEKVLEIKRKIKEIQEEAKKKKKEGDIQGYQRLLNEMNPYIVENFRMMSKPLSISLIPNLILFFFLSQNYKNTIFKSPLPLPLIGENIHWILFFLFSSISLNMLFKKIFDLDF